MEGLNISPNRMELRKVRTKLKTANKGHELLKDKTSGLIKLFYKVIKQTREERLKVEEELKKVLEGFNLVLQKASSEEVEFLLNLLNKNVKLNITQISNLGAICPNVEIESQDDDNMSYSPLSSSYQFDFVMEKFFELFPKIISLANTEKTAYILADEIEKSKRRTKALENVLIPQYENITKSIEQKLSNSELENTARLKSIKKNKIDK